MADTNEKCQAGCSHPRRAHEDGICLDCCDMNARELTLTYFHKFDSFASLQARIAELEEAHASEMALTNRHACANLTYGRHFDNCTGDLGADNCCECGWSDTAIEARRTADRELPEKAELHLATRQSLEQKEVADLNRKLALAESERLTEPALQFAAKAIVAEAAYLLDSPLTVAVTRVEERIRAARAAKEKA